MKRRLSSATPTPEVPEAKANAIRKVRQHDLQQMADRLGIGITPVEMDKIITEAAAYAATQHDRLTAYTRYTKDQLLELRRAHPERCRYSALANWMDETMDDRTRAIAEAVSLLDPQHYPRLAFFDTETTGLLRDDNVPVTAAACTTEGTSLLDIRMAALASTGEVIPITAEASRVNHLTDNLIATFQPLEADEFALITLEGLVHERYIFAGYYCDFDRQMMVRALKNAHIRVSNARRAETDENIRADQERLLQRLHTLLVYFDDVSHWIEVKPTLVMAIGLDPKEEPGKRTRLEDIGRATRALVGEEKEAHDALADCQLIVRCIQKLREDLNSMPGKTTTPKPPKKPNGPFPPAANPAEKEMEPAIDQAVKEVTEEIRQYIDQLETSVEELQEINGTLQTGNNRLVSERDALAGQLDTANARIAELEAACETYALESGGHRHQEAQTIGYLTMEVNGWPVNWTVRQGISPEQALDELFNYLRFVQLIKASDKVKTLRVSPDKWTELRPMKGFEKAAPTDEPTPEGYNPGQDRPAQPKGNGSTPAPTSRPAPATAGSATPPPATKPVPPPASQPAKPAGTPPPTGKQEGAPGSQVCSGLRRNQINGVNAYDLPFLMNNGQPAEYPFKVAKGDTANFEKFLAECGWTPDAFNAGETYAMAIRVDWVWGAPVNKDKPEGARFRNQVRFTLLMDQPA